MTGPLTGQHLDEIQARAQAAYDGGDPLQTVGYDVPALLAEVRRLRDENEQLTAERDEAQTQSHADLDAAIKYNAQREKAGQVTSKARDMVTALELERDELAKQIGDARSETTRLDTAATRDMYPSASDVCDALAKVETHLAGPQHRPPADGNPAI